MMSGALTIRRTLGILALTAAWCGLWQSVSFANVLSGTAISATLVLPRRSSHGNGSIQLRPLIQLGWLILVDLVTSTFTVAVEVLTPTDRTDEAIIALRLPPEARPHLLLLTTAITLTPGTAVVELDPDAPTVYLHLLHDTYRDRTIAHVNELAELVCAALPARQGTTS